MGQVIVSLLPLIIASALVPAQIILYILIIKSPEQNLLKASAFVGGKMVVRLLQGLIFGLILSNSAAATAEESGGKSPVGLVLLLVLGIFFLSTAYKKWSKEEDPDAPPPKWLARIDRLTPRKAFGLGFGLLVVGVKFWVFTLAAIAVIGEAQLGQPDSAIVYLVFVLLAESLLLLPILLSLIIPRQVNAMLEQVSTWMNRNMRPITIGVSLFFGIFFFFKGASGLLNL